VNFFFPKRQKKPCSDRFVTAERRKAERQARREVGCCVWSALRRENAINAKKKKKKKKKKKNVFVRHARKSLQPRSRASVRSDSREEALPVTMRNPSAMKSPRVRIVIRVASKRRTRSASAKSKRKKSASAKSRRQRQRQRHAERSVNLVVGVRRRSRSRSSASARKKRRLVSAGRKRKSRSRKPARESVAARSARRKRSASARSRRNANRNARSAARREKRKKSGSAMLLPSAEDANRKRTKRKSAGAARSNRRKRRRRREKLRDAERLKQPLMMRKRLSARESVVERRLRRRKCASVSVVAVSASSWKRRRLASRLNGSANVSSAARQERQSLGGMITRRRHTLTTRRPSLCLPLRMRLSACSAETLARRPMLIRSASARSGERELAQMSADAAEKRRLFEEMSKGDQSKFSEADKQRFEELKQISIDATAKAKRFGCHHERR
jgi:hypothetical protein